MASHNELTGLLDDWSRGDRAAFDRLLPLVYTELRRIAASQLRRERADHTLQPTALVHEAYLRLASRREVDWQNRAQFFAIVARVMRRILVDHARRHRAAKRGEGAHRVSIEEVIDEAIAAPRHVPILALDRALDRLERLDAPLARIIELRAFGGATIDEAAVALNVSPSTAKREWRTARAWIARELGIASS